MSHPTRSHHPFVYYPALRTFARKKDLFPLRPCLELENNFRLQTCEGRTAPSWDGFVCSLTRLAGGERRDTTDNTVFYIRMLISFNASQHYVYRPWKGFEIRVKIRI